MMSRRCNRGAATLGAALLLTMVLTLAVLYAHRGLLFEQRSAANQYRAAQAFELAEGGIDWAVAALNDPRHVDDSCSPAAPLPSFRDRYLDVVGQALQPLPDGAAACRWSDGAVACDCPAPGTASDPAGSDAPRFATVLEPVNGDGLVRLVSRGCVGGDAPCVAGAPSPVTDATAQSTVVLQWVPGLRLMPVAALTAGGSVQLGGGVRVSNLDARNGARLVHAGANVAVEGAAVLAGPEGTPVHALIQEHDATLGPATMPVSLLGAAADAWAQRAVVRRVVGTSPAERGAALLAAQAEGFRAFHADGDVLLDVDHVGAPDQPVLVVSGHRLACTRPCRLHGLVYGDVAIRAAADLQNVTVQGAVVTRGHHVQAGSGGVEYDAQTLERLRRLTGLLVKVPGSWRDF